VIVRSGDDMKDAAPGLTSTTRGLSRGRLFMTEEGREDSGDSNQEPIKVLTVTNEVKKFDEI